MTYFLNLQKKVYTTESHIANTYSALESLVSGLSPDNDSEVGKLLSNKDFKRITNKLKTIINNEEISMEIREGISKKIGELNRRSIIDRLMTLLDRYQVPITKVWPPKVDVRTKLHEIIKRRNIFIHQGRIDDYSQFYDDMARLRVLIELWILKLIGCEDEYVNDVTLSQFTR